MLSFKLNAYCGDLKDFKSNKCKANDIIKQIAKFNNINVIADDTCFKTSVNVINHDYPNVLRLIAREVNCNYIPFENLVSLVNNHFKIESSFVPSTLIATDNEDIFINTKSSGIDIGELIKSLLIVKNIDFNEIKTPDINTMIYCNNIRFNTLLAFLIQNYNLNYFLKDSKINIINNVTITNKIKKINYYIEIQKLRIYYSAKVYPEKRRRETGCQVKINYMIPNLPLVINAIIITPKQKIVSISLDIQNGRNYIMKEGEHEKDGLFKIIKIEKNYITYFDSRVQNEVMLHIDYQLHKNYSFWKKY